VTDFNNTVQTVTFPAGNNFQTQDITLEFFDDALTESLTEFYILVVRLDSNAQNNAADVSSLIYEPRNGFAVIGIIDDDGMSTVFQSISRSYDITTHVVTSGL